MGAAFLIVVTFVAGLLTSACSWQDEPQVSPPKAFADRPALRSCGEIRASGPGSGLLELCPQAALGCLAASRDDRGAELSVTAFTTEGDPVRTFYRTAANSVAVEVFLDRSRDGGKEWVQISCEVPVVTADALQACTKNY